MTKLLPKPPWASSIWCDDRSIYVEPPCPEGKAPHIATYAKTEGGLAKALAMISQLSHKDRAAVAPGYYRRGEAKPKVTKPAAKELKSELQQATKRVLQKLGMI